MATKCKVDGCDNNTFVKGYCPYHKNRTYLSNDKLKVTHNTKKKRKSLKRAKKSLKHDFGFKSQVDLFIHTWGNEKHECWLTGVPLNFKIYSDEWLCCMAHVIRKSQYTYFKLNPDNIRLLHPDVHYAVDNFTEDMREKYPEIDFNKWFDLQSEMKKEYEIYKHKNLLA